MKVNEIVKMAAGLAGGATTSNWFDAAKAAKSACIAYGLSSVDKFAAKGKRGCSVRVQVQRYIRRHVIAAGPVGDLIDAGSHANGKPLIVAVQKGRAE